MGELKDEITEDISSVEKFVGLLNEKMNEIEELSYSGPENPLRRIAKKLSIEKPNLPKKEYQKQAKLLAKKMFPKIIGEIEQMNVVLDGFIAIVEEQTSKMQDLQDTIGELESQLEEAKDMIDRI